jgi:NodT family efflux transporter outer membrane factor (OMF) lipoprotein
MTGLALAVCVALSGCAVGPDYKRPAAPSAGAYVRDLPASTVAARDPAGAAQVFAAGMEVPARWWALLGSPAIDALVEAALKANPTLPAAEAALRQAEAAVRAQRAFYYPQVGANLAPVRQRAPTGTLASGAAGGDTIYNVVTAQLTVGYTADVFGLNRRTVESLAAQREVQRAQLAAAYAGLTANVVLAAVQEASLRAQIEATEAIIALQRESVEIFRKQFALGAIGYTDVAAQETALAQSRATLPPLRKQLAITRDLLAALTGRLPADMADAPITLESLNLPAQVPLGVPSKLVERRPDVRAAEAALHSASAQIGVATASMLPAVTIGAGWGASAATFATLSQPANLFWTLGANIAQAIFTGGALTARKAGAEAAYDQAAALYKGTVLGAFQNVADSLEAVRWDAETLEAQVTAEAAARETLQLVTRAVNLGAQSYLALITAQQALQQTRLALVQARAARLSDTVALYQALGGAWWDSGLPDLQADANRVAR